MEWTGSGAKKLGDATAVVIQQFHVTEALCFLCGRYIRLRAQMGGGSQRVEGRLCLLGDAELGRYDLGYAGRERCSAWE
jgi:hypothetical protein